MDQNKRNYLREWQKNNPDKVHEYRRRYYELNADKLRAKSREYYKTHTQYMIEKNYEWKKKNRERYLSKQREYYRERKAKLVSRWPYTFLEMVYASCKNKDWIRNVTAEMMEGNGIVDWTLLSDRNKEIVLQRYRDGKTCREVAALQGISHQRVSGICIESINRLRDKVEGYIH